MLDGLNEDIALPILRPRRKIRRQSSLVSVTGRKVLVTGGGGSIGSELVAQLAGRAPAELMVTDSSEFNLYEVTQTLEEAGIAHYPLLLNVRDARAIQQVMSQFRPHIVYHAAALKHVPLLQSEHNTTEAVLTNVNGTSHVATWARAYGAALVLISSDKAVNPSSIMGTTKRAAELAVMQAAEGARGICQVRFGNVLGSSGSVVPLFRRQIAQGGPVTVTDRRMTRYMMSKAAAVRLVLMAGELSHGCDTYRAYVLDMGDPVRVVDLAEALIRQVGLVPNDDIEVLVTGVRPGEKLEEELTYPWESMAPTPMDGVLLDVAAPYDYAKAPLMDLMEAAEERCTASVRERLLRCVPEFNGAWT